MFFGILVSLCQRQVKAVGCGWVGGVGGVISAGTQMGVNLIDCCLITNTQESPDVGQRDGRSKNTGAPVGFALGGGSSKRPRHRHPSLCYTRVSCSGARTCRSSVFFFVVFCGANLQVDYLPCHLQWWDVHLKGVSLAPNRAQSREKTTQAAHCGLRATWNAGRLSRGSKANAKTGEDTMIPVVEI